MDDLGNLHPLPGPQCSLLHYGGLNSLAVLPVRGSKSRLGVSWEPKREAGKRCSGTAPRAGSRVGPGGAWAARGSVRRAEGPQSACPRW